MSYTKGEWEYCQANKDQGGCRCGLIWSREQDAVIAKAIQRDETGERPLAQMIANANLMAKSPRMYELLEKMVKQGGYMYGIDVVKAKKLLAEGKD